MELLTLSGLRKAVVVAGLILPKNEPDNWSSSEPDNADIYIARPTFSGPQAENPKRAKFDAAVKEWKRATWNCSVLAQRYAHPAYRRILALGPDAIPWILGELKRRPDRWFSALADLADYYEIGPEHTFDSAVAAWLKWGRDNGYEF